MHCSWLKRRAEHPTMEHSCLPHDKHPGTTDCFTFLGKLIATVDHLVIICYSLLSPTALLETFWLNIRGKKGTDHEFETFSSNLCSHCFLQLGAWVNPCMSPQWTHCRRYEVIGTRSELTLNSSAFKELFSLMIKSSWVLGLCEHLSVHSGRKGICLLICLKTLATY